MAFFKLFGAVCRCCSAKYRELWLVCERGNDARDNGYWFYRYLKEKHPEINARYVIEADSADRAKIEALGGMNNFYYCSKCKEIMEKERYKKYNSTRNKDFTTTI